LPQIRAPFSRLPWAPSTAKNEPVKTSEYSFNPMKSGVRARLAASFWTSKFGILTLMPDFRLWRDLNAR
jgi:hypothetical protein